MESSPAASMQTTQQTLLSTGKYSDLVLKCKTKDFKVHCSVVCLHSDVIASKVERWSDGGSPTFNMDEEDVQVVEAFVEYLYLGKYEFKPATEHQTPAKKTGKAKKTNELVVHSTHRPGTFVFHVKMYIAADTYNVATLKAYSANEFFLATADFIPSESADATDFAEAVGLLCDNITSPNDTQLKKIVGKVLYQHLETLIRYEQIAAHMPQAEDLGSFLIEAAGDSRLPVKIGPIEADVRANAPKRAAATPLKAPVKKISKVYRMG